MQVGLISDIHGNLPALESVLEDMPSLDTIVCAGDVIGYNPWPAACVEKIREVADITVMGNHDRMVRTPHEYGSNHMAEAGLEFANEQLSNRQLKWLDDRPRKATFVDDQFLLVHDHPTTVDEYVYPVEFDKLRCYLDNYRGLVLGHTHMPHEQTIDDRIITNPGSVGQPRDKDPRAAYAILNTDSGDVELKRTSYDIDRVISRIEEVGLPAKIGSRLVEGS